MATIRCMFLGDVVGKAGCAMFQKWAGRLRAEYRIDALIVNGENANDMGRGISPRNVTFFKHNGAQVITTGNHIWKQKEIYPILQERDDLLRPANFPPGCPGKGYTFIEVNGYTVAIVNLQGRVFMQEDVDCPFRAIDSLLPFIRSKTNMIFIDFHAETTSEKQGLSYFLDGRVSGVYGTHTHAQTADEKILPNGTSYISDLGYAGAYYSMLGMRPQEIVHRFVTQMPARFSVALNGPFVMHGIWVDVDTVTGKTIAIERIKVIDDEIAQSLE